MRSVTEAAYCASAKLSGEVEAWFERPAAGAEAVDEPAADDAAADEAVAGDRVEDDTAR